MGSRKSTVENTTTKIQVNQINLFGKEYASLIFDLDGVVLDSNFIKEENIRKATRQLFPKKIADDFTEYFISLNGVPREEKTFAYFTDKNKANKLLDLYNSLNEISFSEVQFTNGFIEFMNKIKEYSVDIYVLSGGDESEVVQILKNKGIINNFKKVMGGPMNKLNHLKNLKIQKKVIYFGDSKLDYEVSNEYQFDFVFMFGYTQFKGWNEFFSKMANQTIIKDFSTFHQFIL